MDGLSTCGRKPAVRMSSLRKRNGDTFGLEPLPCPHGPNRDSVSSHHLTESDSESQPAASESAGCVHWWGTPQHADRVDDVAE